MESPDTPPRSGSGTFAVNPRFRGCRRKTPPPRWTTLPVFASPTLRRVGDLRRSLQFQWSSAPVEDVSLDSRNQGCDHKPRTPSHSKFRQQPFISSSRQMLRHQVLIRANRLQQELPFLQPFLCPYVSDPSVPERACALPADDPADGTAVAPHLWNHLVNCESFRILMCACTVWTFCPSVLF